MARSYYGIQHAWTDGERYTLGPRFSTVVAVEGIIGLDYLEDQRPVVPLTVLAAEDDERFSLSWVIEQVDGMQDGAAPVQLRTVPGTHMAFFTHRDSLTEAIGRCLVRRD